MPSVGPAIAEPDRQLDTRCIRSDGEGPLIHADRVALRQLEFYIRTGVNAIRGRGVEVGGLILGHPINWNGDEVVIITGFIPVEIEYRFGPTFRPSEADVNTFREAAAEEEGNVIGYYRSQLRNGFSLREEDRHLLTALFRATDCCFAGAFADSQAPTAIDLYKVRAGAAPVLLERFPLKEQEPTVTDAEPQTDEQPLELIFVLAPEVPIAETPVTQTPVTAMPAIIEETPAEILRLEEAPVADGLVVEKKPEPPPHPVPETLVAAPPAPMIQAANAVPETIPSYLSVVPVPSDEPEVRPAVFTVPNSKRVRWVTAGVIAGLIVTAVAYTSRQHSVPESHTLPVPAAKTPVARRVDSAIGLHIVRRGPEIEIRWDPDNPFVRTSVRGSLIIRETAESHIDLDAARVQSGVYSYKPVRNFLTLALTIYHADGSYTDETTTFTRAPEPEASPLQRPSNVPALTRAKQPSTNPPLPRAESDPPAPRSNPAVQPVAPPVTNTSGPDVQATQRSVETPQSSSSEHAAALPEPARAAVAADPPAVNAAAVPVPQPPAPPSPSPDQGIANTFVGPHIVHQAVPAIPLGVAASIRGAVQVEVRVTIDASGKVSGARVVASTGGAASLLTIEALKAAQLCRFAAAEENGHPVASSMVVTFRFARKSN